MSLLQRDTTPFCRLNTIPDDNVQFIAYLKGICFSLCWRWRRKFSSLFESL